MAATSRRWPARGRRFGRSSRRPRGPPSSNGLSSVRTRCSETATPTGSPVAVRSSATAEDLPGGELRRAAGDLSQRARRRARWCAPAGGASPRSSPTGRSRIAIDHGFDHLAVALSVGVQRMVRSDIGASGRHVHARHRDRLPRRGADQRRLRARREPSSRARSIPTSSGLQADAARGGPARSSSGRRREGLEARLRPGRPAAARGGRRPRTRPPEPRPTTSAVELARWRAWRSRTHYSPAQGEPTPMDIEWAKDGVDGRALHRAGASRDGPSRRAGRRSRSITLRRARRRSDRDRAQAVGQKIGGGPVRVVRDACRAAASSSRARCWSPT